MRLIRLLAAACVPAILTACALAPFAPPTPAPAAAPVATAAPAGAKDRAVLAPPAPPEDQINDGPHVKDLPGGAGREALWICNNVMHRVQLAASATRVAPRCGYPNAIVLREDSPVLPAPVTFTAKRLVVFSDVHGQFDLLVRLLQANKVIDAHLNWSFGDGHMVVIGDHFDRGPRVTEVLWLLHQLEPQARAAGGMLHALVGNHETMVLYDDLRYVHPKYAAIARLHGAPQPAQFGADSVLGRWLRVKPVVIQVNDMLFVHGGFGPDFMALNLSLTETNEHFRRSIGQPRATVRADALLAKLYGAQGPVWHRGYFTEPRMSGADIDAVLARHGVKRIVVGHTPMRGVFSHHGGRVLSVDSDMQKGRSGELLFWDAGMLTRGTLAGERLPLPDYTPARVPDNN
ncbi:MAG: metallophosphoesterase [Betaproteobacteria bacterium]|nr:metallophosphoesterase [Betaproteobacteria bacterium]